MTNNSAFPVGAYLGNANGNDPTENAQFEAAFNQFSQAMGARPGFFDTFTDNSEGNPSTWVSNASWDAWSNAMTGSSYVGPGSGIVPVIGIPMAWSGEEGTNVDAAFKDIASGKYDAAFTGIVKAWIAEGYKTMQFRIGYEFNVAGMPWDVLDSNVASAGADFVAAFQRIATLLHAAAAAAGVTVQVAWNPGT
jgi:hypothetical protein